MPLYNFAQEKQIVFTIFIKHLLTIVIEISTNKYKMNKQRKSKNCPASNQIQWSTFITLCLEPIAMDCVISECVIKGHFHKAIIVK